MTNTWAEPTKQNKWLHMYPKRKKWGWKLELLPSVGKREKIYEYKDRVNTVIEYYTWNINGWRTAITNVHENCWNHFKNSSIKLTIRFLKLRVWIDSIILKMQSAQIQHPFTLFRNKNENEAKSAARKLFYIMTNEGQLDIFFNNVKNITKIIFTISQRSQLQYQMIQFTTRT